MRGGGRWRGKGEGRANGGKYSKNQKVTRDVCIGPCSRQAQQDAVLQTRAPRERLHHGRRLRLRGRGARALRGGLRPQRAQQHHLSSRALSGGARGLGAAGRVQMLA